MHGKRAGSLHEAMLRLASAKDLHDMLDGLRGNPTKHTWLSKEFFRKPPFTGVAGMHNPFHPQCNMLVPRDSGDNPLAAVQELRELFFVGIHEAIVESKYVLLHKLGVLLNVKPEVIQRDFKRDCKAQMDIERCRRTGDCSHRGTDAKKLSQHLQPKDAHANWTLGDYRLVRSVGEEDQILYEEAKVLFFTRLLETERALGAVLRCSSLAKRKFYFQ